MSQDARQPPTSLLPSDATIVSEPISAERTERPTELSGDEKRGESDPPVEGEATPLDSCRGLRAEQAFGDRTETPAVSTPRQSVLIMPSSATIGSVVDEARKPQTERLHIEARIASGGMGTIDAAYDRALDRRIAIKTLHPFLRSEDQTVRMFLREARLTGLLDHPHIVPLYDLGERKDGELAFTMKLVEGRTLGEIIHSLPKGPLETSTLYMLLDVFTKICDALAFAHSRGVIHCDVKPANVMVGEFGQVFLMDWGIARLLDQSGQPSLQRPSLPGTVQRSSQRRSTDKSVIGTPSYMSPEQARGERTMLDVRSDIFLLGALLYEVLTRQAPYQSQERSEIITKAVNADFPGTTRGRRRCRGSTSFERIVLRAMQHHPASRYSSVVALKEDIVRFMRGGGEFPRRTYAAGQAIVKEGDPGDAAFILVEGRCEIRKESLVGDQALDTIGPGTVFGEMSILTEGPRTASVIAIEPTTVLVVTAAALEQEMAALKPWVAALLRSLAARFRQADTQSRAPQPVRLEPARIAKQLLLELESYGATNETGARSLPWLELRGEVEQTLRVSPFDLAHVVARYGFRFNDSAGTIVLEDPSALRARIRDELGR